MAFSSSVSARVSSPPASCSAATILGRGLVTGTGTIVARGLFEVELSFTCIDDDNNLGTPLLETLQYRLESRGRILVVPGLDGAPDILLHRTSR
jgi:hypothetical protein